MVKTRFFKQRLLAKTKRYLSATNLGPDLITATPCILACRLQLALAPLVTRMKWAGSHHTETVAWCQGTIPRVDCVTLNENWRRIHVLSEEEYHRAK